MNDEDINLTGRQGQAEATIHRGKVSSRPPVGTLLEVTRGGSPFRFRSNTPSPKRATRDGLSSWFRFRTGHRLLPLLGQAHVRGRGDRGSDRGRCSETLPRGETCERVSP